MVKKHCNCLPYALKYLLKTNLVSNNTDRKIKVPYHMTIFQLMCTDNQLACAQKHIIDASIHLKCLMPCEGIFADVRKLPPTNSTIKIDKFIEGYEEYKSFFEPIQSKMFLLQIYF